MSDYIAFFWLLPAIASAAGNAISSAGSALGGAPAGSPLAGMGKAMGAVGSALSGTPAPTPPTIEPPLGNMGNLMKGVPDLTAGIGSTAPGFGGDATQMSISGMLGPMLKNFMAQKNGQGQGQQQQQQGPQTPDVKMVQANAQAPRVSLGNLMNQNRKLGL